MCDVLVLGRKGRTAGCVWGQGLGGEGGGGLTGRVLQLASHLGG